MRKLIYILGSIVFLFLPNACKSKKESEKQVVEKQTKPLNIIFLIGDGMGLSQVSSVFYFPGDQPSNFTRFKQLGLINTSSAKEKITDSAAGATAFANGKRSYNGAIGVDTDTNSIENIVEWISKKGYSTGIVATSSITHATPACYYAHVPYRKMEMDIASQLITSEVDFFAGGGIQFFRDKWTNLLENYVVDTNQLKMEGFESSKSYGFLLAEDGMPKMSEGRGDFLPNATTAALNYLSAKDSAFFLVIEGSQIDWGGHANDGEYIIGEMHDFDKTIGVAMDYAEKNGNTLVVVTADHETGGFSLAAKRDEQHDGNPYENVMTTFSTGGHTSTLIPVFSYGPGSEQFDGIYDNTGIFHKMKACIQEE